MVLHEEINPDRLRSAPKVPALQPVELPGTELEARCLAILEELEKNSPIPQ